MYIFFAFFLSVLCKIFCLFTIKNNINPKTSVFFFICHDVYELHYIGISSTRVYNAPTGPIEPKWTLWFPGGLFLIAQI